MCQTQETQSVSLKSLLHICPGPPRTQCDAAPESLQLKDSCEEQRLSSGVSWTSWNCVCNWLCALFSERIWILYQISRSPCDQKRGRIPDRGPFQHPLSPSLPWPFSALWQPKISLFSSQVTTCFPLLASPSLLAFLNEQFFTPAPGSPILFCWRCFSEDDLCLLVKWPVTSFHSLPSVFSLA